MIYRTKLYLAALGCFLLICQTQASLLEKAQLLDKLLNASSTEQIIAGFESTSMNGSQISNIMRNGKDSTSYKALEYFLSENLGEILIKHFTIHELKILEALVESGGANHDFAIRIMCLSCSNDQYLSQSLNEINRNQRMGYRIPTPPSSPPPPAMLNRNKEQQITRPTKDSKDR